MGWLRGGLTVGLIVLMMVALLAAATPGSFRGKIVEGPSPAEKNWLYIQGRNGMVRRVDISHARVEYDDDVPAASRSRNPQEALRPGADVRVTAEQGSDGEWRASRVEILDSGAGTERSAKGIAPLSGIGRLQADS
jgi:hypothetical protein